MFERNCGQPLKRKRARKNNPIGGGTVEISTHHTLPPVSKSCITNPHLNDVTRLYAQNETAFEHCSKVRSLSNKSFEHMDMNNVSHAKVSNPAPGGLPLLAEYNELEDETAESPCEPNPTSVSSHQQTNDECRLITMNNTIKKMTEENESNLSLSSSPNYPVLFKSLLEHLRLIRLVSGKYEKEKKILDEANIDPEAVLKRVRSKYQRRLAQSKQKISSL